MSKYVVAIPVYNEEEYIVETLLSFDSGDFLEKAIFVLVDNNSTDKTREVIKNFVKNNARFSIALENEKKQGVEFTRKKSLDIALKYSPDVVIGTDADTIFNQEILKEIKVFADSDSDVFVFEASMGPEVKLHRMVYFPDFVKTTNLLWKLEYELFGPYIFGASFAIKAESYSKIKDFFNVDSSPVIYQNSGEDILLGRRAHYLGLSFKKGKSKVLTSLRRYTSNIYSWLTFERGKFYRDGGNVFEKNINSLLNNKKQFEKKRIENTAKRWIRYAADAKIFSDSNKTSVGGQTAYKNFLNFFNYDTSYDKIAYKNSLDLEKKLTIDNFKRVKKILQKYLKDELK